MILQHKLTRNLVLAALYMFSTRNKEKKNTQKSKKTLRLYIIKTKSHKKSLNEKKRKK